MTNLFIEELNYVNLEEYKESINNTWLSDDEIKINLRKAEKIIDDEVWKYWTKIDPLQKTIFPVVWEDIPLNIKQATILIASNIFNLKNTPSRVIASEKRRWSTIVYDTDKEVNKYWNKYINEEIYLLLKPYVLQTINSFFRT